MMTSPTSSAAVPLAELYVPDADRFFIALDQRPIGPTGWVALVLGIHSDDRGWWIQVGRADNPSVSVVLRTPLDITVDRLVAALESWRPTSADLDVRHLM